jgi:hypothetical protein
MQAAQSRLNSTYMKAWHIFIQRTVDLQMKWLRFEKLLFLDIRCLVEETETHILEKR